MSDNSLADVLNKAIGINAGRPRAPPVLIASGEKAPMGEASAMDKGRVRRGDVIGRLLKLTVAALECGGSNGW